MIYLLPISSVKCWPGWSTWNLLPQNHTYRDLSRFHVLNAQFWPSTNKRNFNLIGISLIHFSIFQMFLARFRPFFNKGPGFSALSIPRETKIRLITNISITYIILASLCLLCVLSIPWRHALAAGTYSSTLRTYVQYEYIGEFKDRTESCIFLNKILIILFQYNNKRRMNGGSLDQVVRGNQQAKLLHEICCIFDWKEHMSDILCGTRNTVRVELRYYSTCRNVRYTLYCNGIFREWATALVQCEVSYRTVVIQKKVIRYGTLFVTNQCFASSLFSMKDTKRHYYLEEHQRISSLV